MKINPKLSENDFVKSTGKRKTAIASVFFKKSNQNNIIINRKDFSSFFSTLLEESKKIIQLLMLLNDPYDIKIFVKGGGKTAQLNAIFSAVANAVSKISPIQKNYLKKNGLLIRDARIKERRKYGLKKARKAPQYSKR
jgi:small subunit ribosomal protein S9